MSIKRTRQKKLYLVTCRSRGYKYGAFPHTPEGKAAAESFVRRKQRELGEDLIISER